MDFFKRNRAWIVGLAVVLIILGFSLRKRPSSGPASSPSTKAGGDQSDNLGENTAGPEKALGTLPWTGILKASQEPDKGNLVLISGNHEIYIRTSRDFSKLIDKTVVVSGTGEINRFQLDEIVPAGR